MKLRLEIIDDDGNYLRGGEYNISAQEFDAADVEDLIEKYGRIMFMGVCHDKVERRMQQMMQQYRELKGET